MTVPIRQKKVSPSVTQKGGVSDGLAATVRENIDVPSLSLDNTFAGQNTFTGGIVAATSNMTVGDLACGGSFSVGVSGSSLFSSSVRAQSGVALESQAGFFTFTGNLSLDSTWCLAVLTSGNSTVTLPDTVSISAGQLFIIKNSGAGTITLATTSSQTIDGAAPGTVAAGAVTRLVSDGANWITI